VYRSKHKSATLSKAIDLLTNIITNLLGGSLNQDILGIDTTNPKDDISPDIFLQFSRVHASCVELHRVEDVHANFDQVRDQWTDRAAGVK
jgi:hypothetical protein